MFIRTHSPSSFFLPSICAGRLIVKLSIMSLESLPQLYWRPQQDESTFYSKRRSSHGCEVPPVSHFRLPQQNHTDQWRNFESDVFRRFISFLGAEKTRITGFHPESDGMVERIKCTGKYAVGLNGRGSARLEHSFGCDNDGVQVFPSQRHREKSV